MSSPLAPPAPRRTRCRSQARRAGRSALLAALAHAGIAHAATLLPITRLVATRYQQPGDASTARVPMVMIGGVQRMAIAENSTAPAPSPVMAVTMPASPGRSLNVAFTLPEAQRSGPMCLSAVARGSGPIEAQQPHLLDEPAARESLNIVVQEPAADGQAVVLVRGGPPRRTSTVIDALTIPRGARLRFALGIPSYHPHPTRAQDLSSEVLDTLLKKGRDTKGVVYQQPAGMTPAVFTITALPADKGGKKDAPGEQRLFRERLDAGPGREIDDWQDREVDLAAYAGRRVGFRFDIEHCAPGPSPAWGDPTILAPVEDRPRRRNILLVSIDTLRASHVGCYGYDRPTSPLLDQLATRSTLFENAYSAFPETAASHMTLLTSLLPCVHGVLRLHTGLRAGVLTLAERLRATGYETGAFTEGGELTSAIGFSRGFAHYVEHMGLVLGAVETTFSDGLAWLTARADTPWFAFVHTYQVHWPYLPPAGYLDQVADVCDASAEYDAEIRYTDDVLATMLDNVPEDTLVIVLSDHGEHFGEHGLYQHANSLYDALLHVPLIMRAPDLPAGIRIAAPVGLVDVTPTILDLAGLSPPTGVQGRSLVPLLRGGTLPPVTLFAEVDDYMAARPLVAGRTQGLKLIVQPANHEVMAFRPLDDPAEEHDLAAQVPADAGTRMLDEFRSLCGTPEPAPEVPKEEIAPAVREQLKALGYVQ